MCKCPIKIRALNMSTLDIMMIDNDNVKCQTFDFLSYIVILFIFMECKLVQIGIKIKI